MEKSIVNKIFFALVVIGLSSCSAASSPPANLAAAKPQPTPAGTYHTTSLWQGDTAAIWYNLQHTSSAKLISMQNDDDDTVKNGWIQLALISKQKSLDTPHLADALAAWRQNYPSHPANQLIPDNQTLSQLQSSPPPQHIAVLLPQSGAYAASGRVVREGLLNSYYQNLAKTGKQVIKFYDTTQSSNMTALYQRAIADGADMVIGPLTKENVQQMTASKSFNAPMLALNYTNTNALPGNFYEFGLLPEDEAAQIADRAHEAGLANAIIIAPQTPWGERLVSAFSARWQTVGGNVRDTWLYSAKSDFNQEAARLLHIDLSLDKKLMKENSKKSILEEQRRHDFDVIFLFSQPTEAHIIVPLLKYYYAGDVPIYAASSIYPGKPNSEKDADLNGVIVCDIPWNKQATPRANNKTASQRLYAVGQDAYLLSQSLQRLTQLPYFPLYGTTGGLTLSSSHQIHRRVPCTPIRDGLV